MRKEKQVKETGYAAMGQRVAVLKGRRVFWAEGVLGRGNSQGGSVPGELWNRQEASEAAE